MMDMMKMSTSFEIKKLLIYGLLLAVIGQFAYSNMVRTVPEGFRIVLYTTQVTNSNQTCALGGDELTQTGDKGFPFTVVVNENPVSAQCDETGQQLIAGFLNAGYLLGVILFLALIRSNLFK